MGGDIIQIRDVPAEDVAILRARAADGNQSLSAYLRHLIHADASAPTMREVLDRIAARKPVETTSAAVRAMIDAERR